MFSLILRFLVIALVLIPSLALAAGPAGPSFLTGSADGHPVDIVLAYVEANRAALDLTAEDLVGLRTEQYRSEGTGITHIRLIQRHGEIDVYHGDILANVAADGSIINLHNRFVTDLGGRTGSAAAEISAVEGVEAAALHLGLTISETIAVETQSRDAELATVLSEGGISRRKIPAQLVWSVGKTARLAWDMSIYETEQDHWWSIRVDAATGEVIEKNDWVVHDRFERTGRGGGVELAPSAGPTDNKVLGFNSAYLVYAWPDESPHHAIPAPPSDGRLLEEDPENYSSPDGWHDTDGSPGAEYTTTQGNNVDAQKNGAEADCGVDLDCSFALYLNAEPTSGSNVDAAIVNLFYWNNLVHDVWHSYGFDEAARNFQVNNYGNGGVGNDAVIANAQASGNCNANFGTPADGSAPTMNMYTCDIATPSRDGDLDNGVIAHEYGHGISNRLTGGASVSCLNNSEQMGEGWSDWFGLMMTIEPGDQGTDARGIGTWLLGEGPDGTGVRNYRYSTDMAIYPQTYADVNGAVVPHGVGEIWASMLWEMTWNLIDEHGFNSFIDDVWSAGGNNLAMQLVIDGLKLQPCSPGFVDGRDAILLADQNLTGGTNQCLIWAAFAKRGLGFSATQGSSSSTSDGTEAFDIPPSCEFLNPTPVIVDVCVGSDAVFDIDVNDAFTPPVTLSASGNPTGSTVGFNPNPVVGPLPVAATLTVGSIDVGAVGSYSMTITGNDGVNNESTNVELNVFPNSLGASTLNAPADGATDVGPMPEMSWSPVVGTATYLLEIDNDPAFGSVDYSVAVSSTVHEVTSFLDALTTYYWRVTPENLCTTGAISSVFSFTTPNVSCGVFSSADVPLAIPEGGGTSGSTVSTLDVADSGEIVSLTLTLDGTHTWMGDLDFNLQSPEGTSVMVMERACSSDNDFDLTLDDLAGSSIPCPPVGGGTYLPSNPLAAFNGEEVNGQWLMTIDDNAGGDSGTLSAWSMDICISAPSVNPIIVVNPGAVTTVQPADWTKNTSVSLNNTGAADLIWTIAEDGGSNCDAPTDIPWLVGLGPVGATTSAGSSSVVSIVMDSTGLGAGQYTADLCVDTNDPATPRVVVPVTLDVVVPLFADNFELGDKGAWSTSTP